MIDLDKCKLIGKGRDRACYEHPEDPSLCIKVALQREKQSKREIRYLKYLEKKNKDLSRISKFQGLINTNLGKGYIFELAKNHNGLIAPTLTFAIQNKLISEEEVKEIIDSVDTYLTEQAICVSDLSPNNITVIREQSSELSFQIIDGIGVAKPNPFITRIPSLINKCHQKALERLKRKASLIVNDNK